MEEAGITPMRIGKTAAVVETTDESMWKAVKTAKKVKMMEEDLLRTPGAAAEILWTDVSTAAKPSDPLRTPSAAAESLWTDVSTAAKPSDPLRTPSAAAEILWTDVSTAAKPSDPLRTPSAAAESMWTDVSTAVKTSAGLSFSTPEHFTVMDVNSVMKAKLTVDKKSAGVLPPKTPCTPAVVELSPAQTPIMQTPKTLYDASTPHTVSPEQQLIEAESARSCTPEAEVISNSCHFSDDDASQICTTIATPTPKKKIIRASSTPIPIGLNLVNDEEVMENEESASINNASFIGKCFVLLLFLVCMGLNYSSPLNLASAEQFAHNLKMIPVTNTGLVSYSDSDSVVVSSSDSVVVSSLDESTIGISMQVEKKGFSSHVRNVREATIQIRRRIVSKINHIKMVVRNAFGKASNTPSAASM